MGKQDNDPVLAREVAFLDGLAELIGCFDLHTAIQKVADLGHSVVGARTCNVRLLNDRGDAFELVGTRGATSAEHKDKWRLLERTRSVVGVVCRTGQRYVSRDIQRDEHYEMKELAARNGLVALIAEPVLLAHVVAGVITLYFVTAAEVTSDREELSAALARLAGRVMEVQRTQVAPAVAFGQSSQSVKATAAEEIAKVAESIAASALNISRWDASGVAMPRGVLGGLDTIAQAGQAILLAHRQVRGLAELVFSMGTAQDIPLDPQQGFLWSPKRAAAFPCGVAGQQVAVIVVVARGDQLVDDAMSQAMVLLGARGGETLLRLRQSEQLETLEGLLATLGVSRQDRLEVDRLRVHLLDLARKQLGAEGAVLYLWEPGLQKYVPRVAKGLKNIRRPVDYAREGYSLGEAFVGQVAAKREMEFLRNLDRGKVDQDPCLRLLRQQTHSRELTLCLGIPIEPPVRHGNTPPLGVVVFADGRDGAGIGARLEGWRGEAVSLLAAQVSAVARWQEILEREDTMFFVATHHAKEPLATVVQLVREIQKRGARPQYLEELARCAGDAAHNVSQAFYVERALSGRPVELADVDLTELLEARVSSLRPMAEARGCELIPRVEPGCRATTVSVYVRGILDNLIDNAIRYSGESGGRVEVALSRSAPGYLMEVLDNGPGLPSQVWEAMQKARGRPRASYDLRQGFGLGLFIVASYSSMLGWGVSVDPNTPRGTAFRLAIPMAPPMTRWW